MARTLKIKSQQARPANPRPAGSFLDFGTVCAARGVTAIATLFCGRGYLTRDVRARITALLAIWFVCVHDKILCLKFVNIQLIVGLHRFHYPLMKGCSVPLLWVLKMTKFIYTPFFRVEFQLH
jgi:hypothetical protein